MAEKEKLSIVVFSDELDRALQAFILAMMGASMGMEVTMFFTFWGLNIVRKNNAGAKGKGLIRKLLNLMNRGGPDRLKLSRLHMFGLGTWMMKRTMKNINLPTISEFITTSHDIGIKMLVCTTSLELLGLDNNSFRSEIDEFVGAAYFISRASKSKVTLFI